jgi:hypothetical protein
MSNDILLYDDLSWFTPARENLLRLWERDTVFTCPDGSVESLACSILRVVDRKTGHLSIACSLHSEADQIEKLLNTTCFDGDPVVFFRLLLFLLDEFTARMHECYQVLSGKRGPKQPVLISIWTNRYAKHRTAILIQHHAQHLFLDEPRHAAAVSSLLKLEKILFIDTSWLKTNLKPDLPTANRDQHAVVLVPKLSEFVTEAIQYYAAFRTFACSDPKALEQFQSPHHWDPFDLTKSK